MKEGRKRPRLKKRKRKDPGRNRRKRRRHGRRRKRRSESDLSPGVSCFVLFFGVVSILNQFGFPRLDQLDLATVLPTISQGNKVKKEKRKTIRHWQPATRTSLGDDARDGSGP